MSKDKTGMGSHTGQHGKYDGGGYIADLAQYDRTYRRFTKDVYELERFHWLDKATRALFIDIITYNPSVNLFSCIKLVFEMPLTGGIFPSHKVENFQLFRVIERQRIVLFRGIVCLVRWFKEIRSDHLRSYYRFIHNYLSSRRNSNNDQVKTQDFSQLLELD